MQMHPSCPGYSFCFLLYSYCSPTVYTAIVLYALLWLQKAHSEQPSLLANSRLTER